MTGKDRRGQDRTGTSEEEKSIQHTLKVHSGTWSTPNRHFPLSAAATASADTIE